MTDPSSGDPYELERVIRAQAAVYETVLTEIRAGRKRSHWMWFIFPGLVFERLLERYLPEGPDVRTIERVAAMSS